MLWAAKPYPSASVSAWPLSVTHRTTEGSRRDGSRRSGPCAPRSGMNALKTCLTSSASIAGQRLPEMASRMVDLGSTALASNPVVPVHHATAAGALSCGGFPADLHRYRTVFPDRWAALLRDHYNGDLRRIMFNLDCSERCARDWLAGKTGPSGPAAILAASRIPGAVEFLTRAA